MEKKQKIFELVGKGLSYAEVGKLFGISRQRVHQILKNNVKYGLYDIRKKVINRDNNECQFCFGKDNLHVHHLDRKRNNNKMTNLMTLCRDCHEKLHRNKKLWISLC